MKKVLLLTFAMLALVGATSAATAKSSATVNVSITATGFTPDEVRVKPGDTVTWKNNDTGKHQVVSDTGVFKSPVLKPGESYSYTFDTESSYSYHDGLKTSSTGAVHVLLASVTTGVSRIRAVYGSTVQVFGSIPSGASGEQVTVHIRPYGGTETTRVLTTDHGTYSFKYRARIKTEFAATWNGTTSQAAPTVLVRPLVIFRTLNARENRFFVRVVALRSYAHKAVRIERQNHSGRWVTTTIVRLNRFSQARFTGKFAPGLTKARAWVTARPGYAFGFSATKLVRR
jgi:plastocyanin